MNPLTNHRLLEMSDVWAQYRADLTEVEKKIHGNLDSVVPLINQIGSYLLRSGGKRIRPLLVTLSARLCGPHLEGDRVALAGVVEYIHAATLLHDDVIDEADIRRGKASARSLWGNHASILVGDYLYARAVGETVTLQNPEINYILADACRKMAEGETLQLIGANDLATTEETYLKIIELKTASLLSASCRIGGVVAEASEERKQALADFGLDLGMAFQVADDMLDYAADDTKLGKSLGKDLNEGKMTLPLIHFLKTAAPEKRGRVVSLLRRERFAPEDLRNILEFMEEAGSIVYALDRAHSYVRRAKDHLACFPHNTERRALEIVADYVIIRDH